MNLKKKSINTLLFVVLSICLTACYSAIEDAPVCFDEDEIFIKNPNLRIETQRCCTDRTECRQAFHDAIDHKLIRVNKEIVDAFVACEPVGDLQYGVCALKTTQDNSQCRENLDCKTSPTSSSNCVVVDDQRCADVFGESFISSTENENIQKRCAICL